MNLLKWTHATLRAIANRTATVNLIVTRRCDLSCTYCRARGDTPEISEDHWIHIVQGLSKTFSVFTVSGGEPLLYQNITSLINRISRHGIAGLCTNARALTRDHLEAMTGLDYLNFSIDHTGGSTVSEKTAFGKLQLMAEYAQKNSFELHGTAVITARNIDTIPSVIKTLALNKISTNLQLVLGASGGEAFDTPQKINNLKKLSNELIKMKHGGYPIRESESYIKSFSDFLENRKAVTCLAGKAYIAVDSDGCLMACQDIAPSHIRLLDIKNIDDAFKKLQKTIPEGCRCWWNCYHQYSWWYTQPITFLISSFLERLRSQLFYLTNRIDRR